MIRDWPEEKMRDQYPDICDDLVAYRPYENFGASRLSCVRLGWNWSTRTFGEVLRLADFDFVTTRLATGAAITGMEDVNALVEAGVTHVIDCRAEFDDAPLLAGHPKILYLWNGVPDDGNPATHGDVWFSKSLQFALPALAAPHSKVYCHCAAGVNRGPSTALAIMLACGFTAVDGVRLIKAARPVAQLAYQAEAIASVNSLGYS